MAESANTVLELTVKREASSLAALLKEMKEGLDSVTRKVQDLTAKVKANQFPTSDGMSYLEAKHLLLLNYCQSLVYYLLRKARGYSIEGHPVVRSLVEIRLFLEKIRPIDKKLEYQIQKLTRVSIGTKENDVVNEKESNAKQSAEDPLKFRPNPDMLVSKTDAISADGGGVYRPPRIAPASMEEERSSRQDRNALRKDRDVLRHAKQSDYMRELIDDMSGKPEEVRDTVGMESREVSRYVAKMEERARREEDLFIRAPLTKMEKKRERYLKKSRYGLDGLTDNFYDEIRSLPLQDEGGEQSAGRGNGGSGMRKRNNKRKRRH